MSWFKRKQKLSEYISSTADWTDINTLTVKLGSHVAPGDTLIIKVDFCEGVDIYPRAIKDVKV